MKNKSASTFWIIIASLIIIAIAGFLLFGNYIKKNYQETAPEVDTRTSREVALTCTTDMATEFHIHPKLTIMINGKEVLVPENLGVNPDCMTSIHTHHDKHVLHVEAPVKKDFTLSDFFAVWKKEFSSTQILDSVVNDTHEIVVTVDGKQVDTFENTLLKDKEEIVISYRMK